MLDSKEIENWSRGKSEVMIYEMKSARQAVAARRARVTRE
jgi:hypothetical protein